LLHPSLEVITSALSVRAVLRLYGFERRLRAVARTDTRARLQMTTPGVGVTVALTFACAIDNPSRFNLSKAAGAYFGMTPTRYQSGETDYSDLRRHGRQVCRSATAVARPTTLRQCRRQGRETPTSLRLQRIR
jgi:transposase